METNDLNFSGRELPAYLGYGLLDERSVRFENDVITADYVLDCNDSIVHKVTWEKSRCEIHTCLHNKSMVISFYPNLERTLLCDFLVKDLSKDDVIHFLSDTASRMGNIYVQRPDSKCKGKQRVIYFPAGLLMSFCLPLLERTDKYSSFLEIIKRSGHISLFRERNTYLLLADPAFNVTLQPLVVAEFLVPIAYMTRAAKTFAESGIIHPDKHYRLMVMDSLQLETTFMQSFVGNGNNSYYAICFKECPEEKHAELVRIFSEAVKGLSGRANPT